MPANPTPHRGRRVKGLLAAAASLACLVGGLGSLSAATAAGSHTAADSSALGATTASDDAQFAANSPAMVQAELIAVKYWGTSPCSGVVSVSWGELDPSINATSTWWNPVAAYGNAAANSQCSIVFNSAQNYDWPMFCTVMVHEIGHLTGHQHVADPTNVMYPIYVAPIPECEGTPSGVAAPAPVAARKATPAKKDTTKRHKAHSRKKKKKKSSAH
jgi:hypothetical protein